MMLRRLPFVVFWLLLGSTSLDVFAAIQPSDLRDLGKTLGPGVQCLLAPSTAYKPGTIFRIDDQHVSYFVNQPIADKIPVRLQTLALGSLSGRGDLSAGVLGWLLGARGPFNARADANFAHAVDVQFQSVTWEVTDDAQVDAVTDWFATYKHKRPNSDYFVVREAWKAGSMELRVSQNQLDDLGAGLSLTKLLHASAWLKYHPSDQYNLSGTFPEPLRVCIKPERLIATPVRGTAIYHTEPVAVPLMVLRQDIDRD